MLNLRSLACVGLFHTRAARRLQIGPSLDLTQTRVSQRYHWKDTVLSIKIEPSGGSRNLKLPRWLIYITRTRIGRIYVGKSAALRLRKAQARRARCCLRPD